MLPGDPGENRLRPYLPAVTKQAWHLDKQSLKGVKKLKTASSLEALHAQQHAAQQQQQQQAVQLGQQHAESAAAGPCLGKENGGSGVMAVAAASAAGKQQ